MISSTLVMEHLILIQTQIALVAKGQAEIANEQSDMRVMLNLILQNQTTLLLQNKLLGADPDVIDAALAQTARTHGGLVP